MESLAVKNLYNDAVFQRCVERINNITLETSPDWGRMNAAQMFSHCAEIIDVSNGKPLKNTPFFIKLIKGMIKKMVLSDKPYPKSSKTHPQYLKEKTCDFELEKEHLLTALKRFKEEEGELRTHPILGQLGADKKGWGMFKHLDHHLRQFGV